MTEPSGQNADSPGEGIQNEEQSALSRIPPGTEASTIACFELLKQEFNSELSKCEEAARRNSSELKDEIARLRKKAAEVDSLVEENKRLLEILKSIGAKTVTENDLSEASSANIQVNQNLCMDQRCQNMRRQLALETRDRSALNAANVKFREQRKIDKEAVKSWHAYHEKLMERVRSAKPGFEQITSLFNEVSAGPNRQTLAKPLETSRSNHDATSASPPLPEGLPRLHRSYNSESEKLTAQNPLNTKSKGETGSSITKQLSSSTCHTSVSFKEQRPSSESRVLESSQSTEAEADQGNPSKNVGNHSQDIGSDPVVLSARQIKRKRSHKTSETASFIKQEPSSDPISCSALAALFPAEPVDLDERSPNVITPRKRKRLTRAQLAQVMHWTDTEDSNSRSQPRSTSLPPMELSSTSQTKSGEERNTGFEHEKPRTSTISASAKFEQTQDRVLQPLSVNRPVSSGANSLLAKLESRYDEFFGLETEDQIATTRELPTPNDSHKNTAEGPQLTRYGRRLLDLLETPVPQRPSPLLQSTTTELQPKSSMHSKSARQNISSTKNHKLLYHDHLSHEPAPHPHPREESLRARPLNRLRLEDFKVNTKSNDGYTYAYNEVIRNQAQRRCLPGCTRPDCCGNQFRKMAEIGGVPTPTRGLFESSQDGKSDDQRLLEQYLGPNETFRIDSMTSEERSELLAQARTAVLAQQLSKHRHQFSRARTPPGFWRTDMPNTQELESDRALSERQVKERIAERYREAIKPNGRWSFRDE